MAKVERRKAFLKERQAMPVEVWRDRSDRLCAHIQASTQFQQAHTILAYFSFRQEPDLSPLFALAKVWGFSRCVGKSLVWHQWSPGSPFPLQTGTYGIPEPHPNAPTIVPESVDLILVPAVACDRQGYRLGYGGGFYDRLLSDPAWADKPTIGIVFDFAYVPKLPHDDWDQPLTGICTESGLFSPTL